MIYDLGCLVSCSGGCWLAERERERENYIDGLGLQV
jgi:hypothetical protein